MRNHIAQMVGGPGTFRFFLQPAVAIVLGIIHGRRDFRAGRPPYFAGLVREREGRAQAIRDGVKLIAMPLIVALVAAFAFQYVIRSRIYVAYGVLFAVVFVATPYLLARGLATRVSRRRASRASRRSSHGGPQWTHETRNPV